MSPEHIVLLSNQYTGFALNALHEADSQKVTFMPDAKSPQGREVRKRFEREGLEGPDLAEHDITSFHNLRVLLHHLAGTPVDLL